MRVKDIVKDSKEYKELSNRLTDDICKQIIEERKKLDMKVKEIVREWLRAQDYKCLCGSDEWGLECFCSTDSKYFMECENPDLENCKACKQPRGEG